MPVVNLPRMLSETQAAEVLGLKPQTLRLWRVTKRVELPYSRFGGAIRYRADLLEKFIESCTAVAAK